MTDVSHVLHTPTHQEWLHDRQPVFLEDKEEWLLTKHGGMALRAPSSNANVSLALSWHPVTQEVGNVSYDKPDSVLDIRQVKGSISCVNASMPVATWTRLT